MGQARARGRWAWWVALLSRRETGEALALFRIFSGVAVILNMGSAIGFDMVSFLWLDAEFGGYRDVGGNWLVQALGGARPEVVWPLVVSTLVAGVTLTLGVFGRVSALVAAQGLLAVASINSHAKGSYDALLVNSLWILVLADATATLSLACRRRTGRWTSDALVASWPRILAITQICVVYTSTGLHKLSMSWTPAGGFSALYYILQQPSWHRGDMTWLAWPGLYQLTQLATAITWVWELTFWMVAVTLYLRDDPTRPGRLRALVNRVDLRLAYVAVGVVLHSSVAALMVVGPFWWITLAYYPCLFHPQELRAFFTWITGRPAARAGPASSGSSAAG
ncbi:MAG: HTTM domain-containing protein [Myxococcales bacterium]|nr:HTTM domain-containing protein [Myxococcales bacterium]MCB9750677.1 HTTM domain-containing protein [Myxococcales bacterium]